MGYWLYLSLPPFFLPLFLCFCPGPAALIFWFAAAPGAFQVGCPPVGCWLSTYGVPALKWVGSLGWLFAPVGVVVQLFCYFVGCSRLGAR